MASTLTGSLESRIVAEYTGAPDNGSAKWSFGADGKKTVTLTNGTAVNQATKLHQDDNTGTVSYDLDAGTLTDPLGVAMAAFSRIVSVRVECPSTNATNVELGGDFLLTKYLTGWVDDALTIPVHPGGFFQFVAPSATGVAVTASTGDVISVTAGANVYTITIVGS